MKKKIVLSLLAALTVCCSALAVFAACGGGNAEDKIADVKISYTTEGTSTKLSWEPVNGVTFSVFRAKSRFGKFELLEENISSGGYTDAMRFAYYKINAYDKSGKILRTFDTLGEELDLFGENVYVFSPEDSYLDVIKVINGIYDKLYDGEFSAERYAVYFKPGVYDERIVLKQAYYTTFAGLGNSPEDVTIRSLQAVNGANGNALINFWRGTENISFSGGGTWAVSQGAYLRRVNINGSLNLHDGGGYASGGFLADSYITGTVNSGSQQQWLSRNCDWNNWVGNVWNMCFLGVTNAPAGNYPAYKYTSVEKTPVIREKPYIVFTDGGYKITVPKERVNSSGCSWKNADLNVSFIDFEDAYFAKSDTDTAQTINVALEHGKHIVFTPGVYKLSEPLVVESDNTVLLGTGLATLTPTDGNSCIQIRNGKGATVAGLLFDAGKKKSQSLLDAGTADGAADKVYVFDCFFRVGGATADETAVDTCLNVYADGSVLDNVWIWRADHGKGVGWNINRGDTGMTVYADDVTAYGLFSEHFKKNNVLWNGERGKVIFYQSEIAYDVPSQSVWMDGERMGFASIKVADGVSEFTACGLGIYSNFHNGKIVLESAMQVPESAGVSITHICSVALSKGVILNVINESGGKVGDGENSQFLSKYIPVAG